jgi:hypothetical protein
VRADRTPSSSATSAWVRFNDDADRNPPSRMRPRFPLHHPFSKPATTKRTEEVKRGDVGGAPDSEARESRPAKHGTNR